MITDLPKSLTMALETLSGLIVSFFTESLPGAFNAFLSVTDLTVHGILLLFIKIIIPVVFSLCVFAGIIFTLYSMKNNSSEDKRSPEDKEIIDTHNDNVKKGLKKRPVTTGALPDDFVLHRASKGDNRIISSSESDKLEFDIDVPEDDDFDIDIDFK